MVPPPARRLALAALLAAGAGCSKDDGSHDREKIEKAKADRAGALAASGTPATKATSPLGDHWIVDLHGQTVTDTQIDGIATNGRVSTLNLSRSTVTDDQLNRVHAAQGVTAFHKIDLSHTAVSDAVLDWLADCPVLAELNVAGTKVTPAGVAKFKQKRKDNKNINARFKSVNVTTG